MGQALPIEMYLADNMMYQQLQPGQWVRAPLDTKAAGMQTQKPSDSLKQLQTLLHKLGVGKQPKGITMSKENGSYVLEMDLTAVEGSTDFLKEMTKAFKSTIEPQLNQLKSQGLNLNVNDIKIKGFKQKMWVDEKDFRLKNMSQQMKVEIPLNNNETLSFYQQMDIEVKGEFSGKIEVPAEVKSSAN